MFEHYTDHARRTVFFARFEASKMGTPQIETEHLLLGILREDRVFRERLPGGPQLLRTRIERSAAPTERFSTSVDLPLSPDCRRALACAAEESAALEHKSIDCGHLLLGLLRVETSAAAIILREFGIEYATYREVVAKPPAVPEPDTDAAAVPEGVAAEPLREATAGLRRMLAISLIRHEHPRGQRLKRTGWTRKEALGHLIDWAAAHQQWFARALAEPKLTASGYPEDTWLAAQHYNELPWLGLVEMWGWLNRLILHVIFRIPEEKLDTPCRIGIAEPIPLQELVRRYVAYAEDIVAQLMMRK
jgi:hypothetical protein